MAFVKRRLFLQNKLKKYLLRQEYKLDLKLHTDQFNSIGGLDLALEMNAKSVDHLEVLDERGY